MTLSPEEPTKLVLPADANPFRAPSARVADQSVPDAGPLLDEPRRVRIGSASEWIATAWRMFKEAPGPWIGMTVVYVLILMSISLVPIVGIVSNVLGPILVAGLMIACEAQARGESPTIASLFEGFKGNVGSLALIGVLTLAAVLGIGLVFGAGLFAVAGAAAAAGGEGAGMVALIAVAVAAGLVAGILMFPLSLAVMWAPALVAIHDVAPLQALKAGLVASVRNWLALLMLGFWAVLLLIPVVLTFGLAALVVGPVLFITLWAGYRDIFRR